MFRKFLLFGLLLPSGAALWAMDDGGPKKRSYGEMSAVPEEDELELCVDDNGLIIGSVAVAAAVKSRPFVCDVEGCGRAFTHSGTLSNHKKGHAGVRPYACDVEGCGRAFTQKWHLKEHLRIHAGERPYVCDVAGCADSFIRSSALKGHKRRMHKTVVPV